LRRHSGSPRVGNPGVTDSTATALLVPHAV
jgi:hypothetical protein